MITSKVYETLRLRIAACCPRRERQAAQTRLAAELEQVAGTPAAGQLAALVQLAAELRKRQLPSWTAGSVASSYVLWLAGLTPVDPLPHGLLFERCFFSGRRELAGISLFCLPADRATLRELWARYDLSAEHAVYVDTTDESLPALAEAILHREGRTIDWRQVDVDDEATWRQLATGCGEGVYQIDNVGMLDAIADCPPRSLAEFAALTASQLRVALGGGELDLASSTTEEAACTLLEPWTRSTHGVLLYQEQIMRVLYELGDIPLATGYRFVLEAAKGKTRRLERIGARFLDHAHERGIPHDAAQQAYLAIREAAGCATCQAHQFANAAISYRSLWLKRRYPRVFRQARELVAEPTELSWLGSSPEEPLPFT